jgi:hypothetical protein
MSAHAHAARPLYLELRALGLEVQVKDNPDGGYLDYGIAIGGLHTLPKPHASSIRQRVSENEEGLVDLVLDRRDPDLDAVRREGYCR